MDQVVKEGDTVFSEPLQYYALRNRTSVKTYLPTYFKMSVEEAEAVNLVIATKQMFEHYRIFLGGGSWDEEPNRLEFNEKEIFSDKTGAITYGAWRRRTDK